MSAANTQPQQLCATIGMTCPTASCPAILQVCALVYVLASHTSIFLIGCAVLICAEGPSLLLHWARRELNSLD